MGRKGFHQTTVDFAKSVSEKLVGGPLLKARRFLKANTGVAPDLTRISQVINWKTEMEQHETNNPLILTNENFFLPQKHIGITSIPTREQDVIALFNQLLAGGVVRGVKVMSTNERSTYDGLVRVVFTEPYEDHIYDEEKNPLGISSEVAEHMQSEGVAPLSSSPMVLEYKFSLDGLIEDIEGGIKNSNDIQVVVVWETGDAYEANYTIKSLLNKDNLDDRQYHGVTHTLHNIQSGQSEMDLIVLSELINYLNDPTSEQQNQEEKYD
jgi:hypothetical protein